MAELIISVSGLRGIVGETLTPEVAIRYVTAFSAGTPEGPFVVTRDGREVGDVALETFLTGVHPAGQQAEEEPLSEIGILHRDLPERHGAWRRENDGSSRGASGK